MKTASVNSRQSQRFLAFPRVLLSGLLTLILGIVIAIALLQVYSFAIFPSELPPSVELEPLLAADGASRTVMTEAGLAVYADGRGRGLARLRLPEHYLRYPFLQISLKGRSIVDGIALRTATEGATPRLLFALQAPRQQNILFLWVSEAWQGGAQELRVDLRLPPGSRIILEPIQLRQLSPLVALRHVFYSLTQSSPWSQASPNFYRASQSSPFFLKPAFFTACIFMAGCVAMIFLSRLCGWMLSPTRGAVVAMLVLWTVLDLRWQWELLNNVQQTMAVYWGKDERQKQLAGPERNLVLAAEEIRSVLTTESEPRIFVSSSIEFLGMRMAYYLFPYNVFWERDEPLRGPSYFQKDDFIVLLQPSEMRMNTATNELLFPDDSTLPVIPVFGRGSVALFQVK